MNIRKYKNRNNICNVATTIISFSGNNVSYRACLAATIKVRHQTIIILNYRVA